MSRPKIPKRLSTTGYGSLSPLQGLAIIEEAKSLQNLVNIPDIHIDESYLTTTARQAARKGFAATPSINHAQRSIKLPHESLCGARLGVYRHDGTIRSQKRNLATVGGVFKIKDRHFALTTAHAFFDNSVGDGSWTDSGFYVTNSSSDDESPKAVQPARISEVYEVVIESFWPNEEDPDIFTKPMNVPLGLVAPSVLHRRKRSEFGDLAEVIWNDELDWALIELTEPALWQINKLQMSSIMTLLPKAPPSDQKPPEGQIVVVGGVSGAAVGRGLGKVSQLRLPWSTHPIDTWTMECGLDIGDYGALAINPETGTIYGTIVFYDAEQMVAHVIPASVLFDSILSRFTDDSLCLDDLFSVGSSPTATLIGDESSDEYQRTPIVRSIFTDILKLFSASIKPFVLQSVDGRRFIRRNALAKWLMSIRRDGIKNVDFMLDDAYPRNVELPVTGEQLGNGNETSLLVFSMLFELGYGNLVHLFMQHGLTDARLPFDLASLTESMSKMEVENAAVIAQEVFDHQWSYCPKVLDIDMEGDIPAHIVIPIHHRQRINAKGGTATLWRVTVVEEFVGKRLQAAATKARFNDPVDKLGDRYHFAVKSSTKSQSTQFESEITAFKAFHEIPNMIGYFGNYTQAIYRPNQRIPSFSTIEELRNDQTAETNNILLEYGDFDLDEFFAATPPPVLANQVAQFWQDISGITEAISDIHNFSIQTAGVTQEYSGWHADIKPDNILIVNGTFKLADPGFARFENSDKKYTRVTGGTKAFSSPEVHSTQRLQEDLVSQAIDIWSLGCVLSVAASWVVMGWAGVTQYQQLRMEALKRLGNRNPRQNLARNRTRSTNRIPLFRTSSLNLEGGKAIHLPEGDCFHDGKNVLEAIRHWHNFLRSVVRRNDTVTTRILDLVDTKMLVDDPQERIEAADLYLEMRSIVHNSETPHQDLTTDIINQILLKAEGGAPTDDDRVGSSGLSEPAPKATINNLTLLAPVPTNTSVRPPSQRVMSTQLASVAASDSGSDDDASSTASKSRQARHPIQNIILNETGGRSVSSSIDVLPSDSQPKKISGVSPVTRNLSVAQARTEVDKKKSLFSRKRKDPFLAKHLENRNIEFLVDNGNTMAKHWSEARSLVDILSSMVKDVDKDGFDLTFTNSPLGLKQKSSSRAVKSAMDDDRAKPSSKIRTDMSQSLNRILGDLYSRIKAAKTTTASGSGNKGKSYTLIVFTDGVWSGMEDPNTVEDTIIRWMSEIARLDGPTTKQLKGKDGSVSVGIDRTVTIQFIQFGDDEEPMKRLQMLHEGLIDYKISEIIDTEPSNGNVWKMLLGSVGATFD